jgi:hypothetical protein
MNRLHVWLWAVTLLAALAVAGGATIAAPGTPAVAPRADPTPERSPEYGLVFISAAGAPANEARYQRGLSTGAGWNRWPLYWYDVETDYGVFDWSAADAVVADDLAHGLQTEMILIGTPGFYSTGGREDLPAPQVGHRPPGWWDGIDPDAVSIHSPPPSGLWNPVFDDGTDVPGPGKSYNADNPWARFVYLAVQRYLPQGITHFEIWNEPELPWFWDGNVQEYARLLKVAYLAAEQAGPDAQILFGGLADFYNLDFLAQTLAVYASDPMAPAHDWFFDILAVHSYSYAWESWYHVWRAGQTLAGRGLQKEIWLNESGVPAWDDYPGPTWDPTSPYRATMQEGAAYVIQSAMYAKFAGADLIFHFMLYDDCGNYPPGTDFPPADPPGDDGVCESYNPCAGDAFGLYRNGPDAACFTQHPQPDTPRPAFEAYRVLIDHLQELEPLWRMRPGGSTPYDGPQEWIAFYRPDTTERVLGLWSRVGVTETAVVTATGASALLVDQTGTVSTVTPIDGLYTLDLGPATNQNHPHHPGVYVIGGSPLLLVETDTQPPQATASAPSPFSPPGIEVSWTGQDLGSGLVDYAVWVFSGGVTPTLWLGETTATSAVYPGMQGATYGFAATARDRAGNQGAPPTQPQVVTTVTLEEPVAGLVATNSSPTALGRPTALRATVTGGTQVIYTWDLGDGARGSGALVRHTYADAGRYSAVVTAANSISLLTATTRVTIVGLDQRVHLPLILRTAGTP